MEKSLLLLLAAAAITCSGCLNQDFERQSLAKYQTTQASTFANFNPLADDQAGDLASPETEWQPKMMASQGTTIPSGRFTGPSGGRFTFPASNRFSFPRGVRGAGRMTIPRGSMSFPSGAFSSPRGPQLRGTYPQAPDRRGVAGRFTWPQQQVVGGFTQPRSGTTFPGDRPNRFTLPTGR